MSVAWSISSRYCWPCWYCSISFKVSSVWLVFYHIYDLVNVIGCQLYGQCLIQCRPCGRSNFFCGSSTIAGCYFMEHSSYLCMCTPVFIFLDRTPAHIKLSVTAQRGRNACQWTSRWSEAEWIIAHVESSSTWLIGNYMCWFLGFWHWNMYP